MTRVSEIPFQTEAGRQNLESLSAALDGLSIVHRDNMGRHGPHFIGINAEARQDTSLISISGIAATPDLVVAQIMGKIHEHCVVGGLPLVVAANSDRERTYRVGGDNNNLVFSRSYPGGMGLGRPQTVAAISPPTAG